MTSIVRFFLENKLIASIVLALLVLWGLATAPFDWNLGWFPRDPVSVDAIPDIGENQQIVFTEWDGRSPQDIENQVTYPLSTALLGIPGVKSVRSTSMMGFSSIYLIFDDNVEFYWSRARILEKLSALPPGLLPEGVSPALGPDATALGQVFWYTLEGRDAQGNPTGGWDLHELRSIQDYTVRYALASAEGVAEVASIGGYVREYQVDADPNALFEAGISILELGDAVRNSNVDVGARTIEMNRVEYIVRGLGYIRSAADIEETVVKTINNQPIRVGDVARVQLGPASRRGALDNTGSDAVGGVVVARYGSNPLKVIDEVKIKISEISAGLPAKTLDDGTRSQVTIVPFYDRTGLIRETLGTLQDAITLQILITIIVVMAMLMHLRSSLLISALLPVSVLICFILMRHVGVDANIVALAGIAIAIGTMVDMGIILIENMLRHLDEETTETSSLELIYRATKEVGGAVITAVSTTIVSFIPVFFMIAAEGKLFKPLAYTKTFALIAAIFVTIVLIPPFAHLLFRRRKITLKYPHLPTWILLPVVTWILAGSWMPLGVKNSQFVNFLFVSFLVFAVIGTFRLFIHYYPVMLRWTLENKFKFLIMPVIMLFMGWLSWQGFDRTFGFIARSLDSQNVNIRTTSVWSGLVHTFPGLGKEFMPSLDEGSFLLMPTTMPHAGIEEVIEQVRQMDMSVASIPEVDIVIGKIGRAESPLDPAPISMFENLILYKSEYKTDEKGRRIRFKTDKNDEFLYDDAGELIPDRRGRYYRQWRDEIRTPDDIWNEIVKASGIPGITSAPKLQPIETRLVMLQTGMRAPMGVKVSGPDSETTQKAALEIEDRLKKVPGIKSDAVFAERSIGKPYIEIDINRQAIARYGLSIRMVQDVIETAIGGKTVTTTVEGRERYPVRVRYPRELRNNPDQMKRILVPSSDGAQIPLGDLADIRFVTGAMEIRSEDTFPVSYVLFDREPGLAEVDAVNRAREYLADQIRSGELILPAGVSYRFAGTFENQVRAEQRLLIIIPIALTIIFLILYLQFRSYVLTGIIFSGILVAWAGGFIMLWLWSQGWFIDFSLFGVHMRELFQMGNVNLSIAVWVGFLALFGIAVDDGVIMATYMKQSFDEHPTEDMAGIREAVLIAGMRRIRPCLMTSATTILALLPILTSTGRGADLMIPMAIPAFGGMIFQMVTLFVVPVMFSAYMEKKALNAETVKS